MMVTLRPFEPADIELVEEWAVNIDADSFMSRHVPRALSSRALWQLVAECQVFWFIILVLENDALTPIGTVYLEPDPEFPKAMRLGIMLGRTENFGKGIGREAIKQSISRMKSLRPDVESVRLRVRTQNFRAQRCYTSVGFKQIEKGSYINQRGELIDYQIMELKVT